MQIVFHIGAHYTDEDLLLKSLLQNTKTLSKHDILVPKPDSYRGVLRDTLVSLRGKPATEEMQDVVLDTILGDAEGDRIVFSYESFICGAPQIFHEGKYYGKMGMKAQWLRNLFTDFEVEFCIGLRDPATHIPTMFHRHQGENDFTAWRQRIDMNSLSWKRVLVELGQAVPDAPITAWCNEDTPLIWPEVLQSVCDHPLELKLKGDDALLKTIMSAEGMTRMQTYMESHPPRSVQQRRRIVTAFLDKFALEEEMEDEIDLPGWSAKIMDILSARYEQDIDAIASMPNVRAILP